MQNIISPDFIMNLEDRAANGDAEAQFFLGVLYYNGQGVSQDFHKAKEWFRQACDNGNQKGCDRYKELNMNGC
jgi:FOG: TPR repeat, SEL1 subfamily